MDRTEKLLCRIDRSMKILELGAGFNPIAPKSGGWNSWSVDHADQDVLREKYRSESSVDASRIEPVDFIWQDGDLDSAIPKEHHNTFEACIASHVIEHLPNPIGFFKSAEKLLKLSGVISLAIPDKRFCFDYFSNPSLTGDFLEAHFLNRCRHSRKTAFNNLALQITSDNRSGWGQDRIANLSFVHSLLDAKKAFENTSESLHSPYVDYHAWYYVPNSFRLVLLELNIIDAVDWKIDVEFPSNGVEFYVTLRRGKIYFGSDVDLQAKRLSLLIGILGDLGTQLSLLSAGQVAIGETGQRAERVSSLPTERKVDALMHLVQAIDLQQTEVLRRLTDNVQAIDLQQTEALRRLTDNVQDIDLQQTEVLRRITDNMLAVDLQQTELLRRLEDQDVKIGKILKVTNILNRLFHPMRPIGRTYNAVRSRFK